MKTPDQLPQDGSQKDISFLRNLPREVQFDAHAYRDMANESGEIISVSEVPQLREDGWYIILPNEKGAEYVKVGEPHDIRTPVYINYMPGGRTSWSKSPIGMEVRYESK